MTFRLYLLVDSLRRHDVSLQKDTWFADGAEGVIFAFPWTFGRYDIKLFRNPDIQILRGDSHENVKAHERLRVMQQKLREFPENLPERVIEPLSVTHWHGNQSATGYVMRHVRNAQSLQFYGEKHFRKRQGISNTIIMAIFRDLHQTVSELHRRGIVIGDFNDENILIKRTAAYLIDADSFQFGKYQCQMFKPEFVDPQLCKEQKGEMVLERPHNTDSDWYAFTVMLMKCLLFVHPYHGSYEGNIPDSLLPLHRLSIFHKEVTYPKKAVSLTVLPYDLHRHFKAVFSRQDRRGIFPRDLLDVHWKQCNRCKNEYAGMHCPCRRRQ